MGNRLLNSRRAQLTVFIILSIVIIFAVIVFFLVRPSLNIEKVDPDVKPVYEFVKDCLKETAENGIYKIGETGGYYIVPEESNDLDNAYYFINGKSYNPSKEEIENQLNRYVSDLSFLCLRNFIQFDNYEITSEKIVTKTEINEDSVVFNIEYPITITKEDKKYYFKNFNDIEIPVRLGRAYNLADRIIKKQLENPEYICFNCIADYASEKDLYVSMIDYNNNSVIFTIRDAKSKLKNEDYSFIFSNVYGGSYESDR